LERKERGGIHTVDMRERAEPLKRRMPLKRGIGRSGNARDAAIGLASSLLPASDEDFATSAAIGSSTSTLNCALTGVRVRPRAVFGVCLDRETTHLTFC
jgi:hypothetical protein